MKLAFFLSLLLLSSCSSLTLTPRGCQSKATYGSDKIIYDHSIKKEYFIWFGNQEVKLKELVNCTELKNILVSIEKKAFVKYNLVLKYNKFEFKDE
jgi:hypothetical protein